MLLPQYRLQDDCFGVQLIWHSAEQEQRRRLPNHSCYSLVALLSRHSRRRWEYLFQSQARITPHYRGKPKYSCWSPNRPTQWFDIESHAKHLGEDHVKLLFLYGAHAERALARTYEDSQGLRLDRKYAQWLDWNKNGKLVVTCLLCETPIRASKGQRLCLWCRVIRQRLMNRRSDHYRRKNVWLSLRAVCRPTEQHLPVERLDRYAE